MTLTLKQVLVMVSFVHPMTLAIIFTKLITDMNHGMENILFNIKDLDLHLESSTLNDKNCLHNGFYNQDNLQP